MLYKSIQAGWPTTPTFFTSVFVTTNTQRPPHNAQDAAAVPDLPPASLFPALLPGGTPEVPPPQPCEGWGKAAVRGRERPLRFRPSSTAVLQQQLLPIPRQTLARGTDSKAAPASSSRKHGFPSLDARPAATVFSARTAATRCGCSHHKA